MKKFLTKLLFNKNQRNVIWRALLYSAYRYRKHGNVDAAVKVQVVMNEIQEKLDIIPSSFTKEEVDKIVYSIMDDIAKSEQTAYDLGVEEGRKQSSNTFISTFDSTKCEECENKDNCFMRDCIKYDYVSSDKECKKDEESSVNNEENTEESSVNNEENVNNQEK